VHRSSIKFCWKMGSLISIVGVTLTSKENYPEWYRKIKHTLIFNDFWDGIYEAIVSSEEEVESKA
jgi:hypothetical protein